MKDIKDKIRYIYFNADGIYYFLSNQGISDHSKRCILRRFFILVDSYFEMIGYLKNELFKSGIIDLSNKKSLEKSIESIKSQWDNNYETIRNKYSAHQQDVDDSILLGWWNEIDYSTITFFYQGMQEIRAILIDHTDISTFTPVDFSEIDFSDTCLKAIKDGAFCLSHDRLALSKKNNMGMISNNEFQRKCMLISSIIDFIFIDCAVTLKTQQYDTYYKNILFDSAWLLLCCDTFSLIENTYEDSDYGKSLLSLSPSEWAGKPIVEDGNSCRNKTFEESIKYLRNRFAAHIDIKEEYKTLIDLFNSFDLKCLHEYCIYHIQVFRRACLSDIQTKMFSFRDLKLSSDIVALSYSEHRTTDN